MREQMHVMAAAAAVTVDEGKSVEAMDKRLSPTRDAQTPQRREPSAPMSPEMQAYADAAAGAAMMLRRR